MKKAILILSLLVGTQIMAKAIVDGKEVDQKKLCEALEYSLPGVYEATEDYYSIIDGKFVKCEEIALLDLKEAGGTELFGSLVGITYALSKEEVTTGTCSKETFKKNIIEEAMKMKARTNSDMEKAMEEGRKTTIAGGCSF